MTRREADRIAGTIILWAGLSVAVLGVVVTLAGLVLLVTGGPQ